MKFKIKKTLVWMLCTAMTLSPIANAAASEIEYLQAAEASTEAATELSTEKLTEAAAEKILAITESEAQTEPQTKETETKAEAETQFVTEAETQTEVLKEETPLETETELQTELVAEETETAADTEAVTEEIQTEAATETQTEIQTEAVTEETEISTETEIQTEAVAEETEITTEKETEIQTETPEEITGEIFPVDHIVVTALETNYEVKLGTPETDFSKIYVGRKEDVEKTPEYIGVERAYGGYEFSFEVSGDVLGQEIYIVPYVAEDAEWYVEEDVKIAVPSEVVVPETLVMEETAAVEEVVELAAAEEMLMEVPDDATETVDNSTALADGVYSLESFSFSGGSGKTTITCEQVTVKNGKVFATIQFSSESYDYVKAAGYKFNKINTSGKSTFEIPVRLNADNVMIGHTTAMSTSREIEYTIHPVLSEPVSDSTTAVIDNTTALIDGVYSLESFSFSGGSGKTTITCEQVTVKNGKVFATIQFSSESYDYVKAAGYKFNKINTIGKSTFEIPIKLNADNIVIGHTTAMSTSKEIAYTIHPVLKEPVPDNATTAVDNSTTLPDDVYSLESFSFEGGSGRTTITCEQITVKSGKVYATIQFSSESYDYVKAAGYKYDKINTNGNSTFEIPVKLNVDNVVIGHTTAMSTSKEITYTIHPVLKEPVPDNATESVDNSTTLADGVYNLESFSFEGGSGRTTITCELITVKRGKAYATIQFSSESYDYVKAAGYKYDKVNTSGNSTFEIPVKLNADNVVIGHTTAMSTSKEITYTIHPVLTESAATETETETQTETETEVETESETETEKETETEGTAPVDPNKPQNGDYRVQVDSSAAMFRVIDCVLTYKGGVMTAKITLSGTGYDKLFMGTSVNAVNASEAQKIGYTVNADGKYVFEVPVSALDTPIAVAAHSHKNATWYDREITFRSEGMTLLTKGEDTKVPESETQKETEKKEDNKDKNKDKNKADKESSYESDLSGGTGRVDSSTGLKDGVYTPDKFSWSGGSGRTTISCSKVTVTGGQAYATIVFSSSNYGYVKANGNKYFPSYGAGTSSFTIPVKLNANNTIIGMTTAMSAAHEITYTIYVYIAGADKKAEMAETETAADQNKLSEKAPEIIGLEYAEEAEIEYAEYFKMYYYDQGITLIEIDMTTESDEDIEEAAENNAEEMTAESEAADEAQESESADEVKDAETLIAELYQNKIVKYLFVPEDAEIPVGLEKEMIVVYLPVDSVYTDSVEAKEMLKEMELEDCITVENEEAAVKPEYKDLILAECDLAILSGEFLQDEEHADLLFEVTERLTTLGIPAIIDRSAFEESEEAKAEWQMIYEKLFE